MDAADRIGAGHRPVAVGGQPRARLAERGEEILSAGALGADDRNGELVHLGFVRGPQGLDVRDGVQC
jgi:hypothetical protein